MTAVRCMWPHCLLPAQLILVWGCVGCGHIENPLYCNYHYLQWKIYGNHAAECAYTMPQSALEWETADISRLPASTVKSLTAIQVRWP